MIMIVNNNNDLLTVFPHGRFTSIILTKIKLTAYITLLKKTTHLHKARAMALA